jgi:hypothetical protein
MPTCIETDSPPEEGKRRESSSFLKKRTKKLLSYLEPIGAASGATLFCFVSAARLKSFLFLFFKKEILPCFAAASVSTQVSI